MSSEMLITSVVILTVMAVVALAVWVISPPPRTGKCEITSFNPQNPSVYEEKSYKRTFAKKKKK